jgi:hypothetical protein
MNCSSVVGVVLIKLTPWVGEDRHPAMNWLM